MAESRFKVFHGQPPLLPGSCIICGSSDYNRYFVDFSVNVRKYGRIYFCNLCFAECEREVNAVCNTGSNFDGTKLGTYLLHDEPKPSSPKRKPGRPKKTDNRVTEQSSE